MDAILMAKRKETDLPDGNVTNDGPVPLATVLFSFFMLIGSFFIIAIAFDGYINLFIHKLDFVSITSVVLIALLCPGIFLLILFDAYLRNIKKEKIDPEKYLKPVKLFFGSCIFAILSAPLLIGPVMHFYLKSQGYEKCRSTQSGLSYILSPNWAKPSVGCEVWEMDYKERDALIEQAKADRHGSRN